MDCQQAQNDLLSAESLNLIGPELSAHIADCPKCQALLANLRRLDAEVNVLPVPAGHEKPSEEFMKRIAAIGPRMRFRRMVNRAVAAIVVLAFTLAAISLIFFNGSSVQADVLIGQLVDWNLAIAHTHDATGRLQVYQEQLAQLQDEIAHGKLAAEDQALVDTLMGNARWLTTEDNAADESQRFKTIADQLMARRQAMSDGAAQHLDQIYQQLMTQGVSVHPQPAGSQPSSSIIPSHPFHAMWQATLRMTMPQTAVQQGAPIEVPEALFRSNNLSVSTNTRSGLWNSTGEPMDSPLPARWRYTPISSDGGSPHAGERLHHAGSHGSQTYVQASNSDLTRSAVLTAANSSNSTTASTPTTSGHAQNNTSLHPAPVCAQTTPRIPTNNPGDSSLGPVTLGSSTGAIALPPGLPIHNTTGAATHSHQPPDSLLIGPAALDIAALPGTDTWVDTDGDSISHHRMEGILMRWVDSEGAPPDVGIPPGMLLMYPPPVPDADGDYDYDWHGMSSRPMIVVAPEPGGTALVVLTALVLLRRKSAYRSSTGLLGPEAASP